MNIRSNLFPSVSAVKISSLHNQQRLSSDGPGFKLILTERQNNVTRITMNNPHNLNGWTVSMLNTLFSTLRSLAEDTETRVVILTGSGEAQSSVISDRFNSSRCPDPYYCAGASLSENIQPMHPRKLHKMIVENNEMLFNQFLEFPKPILVAANGPAIGAAVTSALLCDGGSCHPHHHHYHDQLVLMFRNPGQ